MAVDYQNWWKLINQMLMRKVRAEFSSSIPITLGDNTEKNKGSQYFIIKPASSSVLEWTADLETREYNYTIHYINEGGIADTIRFEHIMSVASRLEAVILNSLVVALEDKSQTNLYDCKITSTEFDVGDDDDPYTVQFDLSCTHSHIIAEL